MLSEELVSMLLVSMLLVSRKIHRSESENSGFGGENCSSREKDRKPKYKM